MPSKRQIEANRRNAGKSTGPRTAEGKAKSAQNSTTHGLTSALHTADTICLHNEAKEQFHRFYQGLLDEFQPRSLSEELLIEDMAVARWRMRRALGIEATLFDDEMDAMNAKLEVEYETINEPARVALAFKSLAATPALSLLNRYESRLSRQYDRAYARLKELRNARMQNEANPDCEHSQGEEKGQQTRPLTAPEPPRAPGPPGPQVAADPAAGPPSRDGRPSQGPPEYPDRAA